MKPVSGGISAILVTIALLCGSQSSEGLRILGLFPLNGKSHFVMSEGIMRSLVKAGHTVDVYSHFPLKNPPKNYNDFSLKGTLPAVQNNMSYEFVQQFTSSVSLKKMFAHLSEPVCNLLGHPVLQKLINNPPKDPPYDLIVVELFLSDCYLAFGRHLNVPMIGTVTTSLFEWLNGPLGNPTNTAYTPSVFSGFTEKMDFWQRLLNTALSTIINVQYRYYGQNQNQFIEKYFGSNYPSAVDLLEDLSLVLVNSHFSLNGIRPFTPAVIPVGGVHIIDTGDKIPEQVQKWLDESKHGCIYVSFGSMVRIETFPKEVQLAFYGAFKSIAPVRVLYKIAKKEDLLPGLPDNVMTYHWLPQIAVLKHPNVKAFVTHGGFMGTQESISAGVPMIGVPLFGDQHLNIKSYVGRKIATKVDLTEITADALTSAIKEVLQDPDYRNNVKRLSSEFMDRPMTPQDTAVYWAEFVQRHPRALRSPAVDMPWWQLHQLDIYGFVAVVLFLAFMILKVILCTLIGCVCPKKASGTKDKLKKKLQ